MLSTDFSTPSFYERNKTITVSMPVYENGPSPVAPTSGTFSLYNQNKEVVVSGSATITNSIATYTVTSTVLASTLVLSDLWQEEWVLTMSDGSVETIRKDAFLVLRSLYNVVNEAMLKRKVTDLASLKPSTIDSFQGYINEAFSDIENKLIQAGKRPYLILNSYALKDVSLNTTLQYIFEDFETYMDSNGRFAQKAESYKKNAELAWDSLKLEYDVSETNKRASAEISEPVVSVIYTNAPPRWGYGSNGSF